MTSPEGSRFTFGEEMQFPDGSFKKGLRRTGRGAFKGARASVAGPVRLMVTGAVMVGASWVSHPSHDYLNTGYDQVEHYGNAVEELGKIQPQDEALEGITKEIKDRMDQIRSTRGFEFDAKRAQVADFAQVISGLMVVSGGIWLKLRREENEPEQEVMDELGDLASVPRKRRLLGRF